MCVVPLCVAGKCQRVRISGPGVASPPELMPLRHELSFHYDRMAALQRSLVLREATAAESPLEGGTDPGRGLAYLQSPMHSQHPIHALQRSDDTSAVAAAAQLSLSRVDAASSRRGGEGLPASGSATASEHDLLPSGGGHGGWLGTGNSGTGNSGTGNSGRSSPAVGSAGAVIGGGDAGSGGGNVDVVVRARGSRWVVTYGVFLLLLLLLLLLFFFFFLLPPACRFPVHCWIGSERGGWDCPGDSDALLSPMVPICRCGPMDSLELVITGLAD